MRQKQKSYIFGLKCVRSFLAILIFLSIIKWKYKLYKLYKQKSDIFGLKCACFVCYYAFFLSIIKWNYRRWIERYIVGCRGVVQLGVKIFGITGVVPIRWGIINLFNLSRKNLAICSSKLLRLYWWKMWETFNWIFIWTTISFYYMG